MEVHSLSSIFRRRWGAWEDVRKRIRQIVLPRRLLAIGICTFVMLYIFISTFFSSNTPSMTYTCVSEHTHQWKHLQDTFLASSSKDIPLFVGNGFIGVGSDGELRIMSPHQKVLSKKVSFYPIVAAEVAEASSKTKATLVDFKDGVVRTVECFTLDAACVCIKKKIYAHRTRPHVLVQDIVTANPTNNAVKIVLSTKERSKWTQSESVDKTFVYSYSLDVDGVLNALGAVCSFVPKEFVVEQKREESERILCVFNYGSVKPEDVVDGQKRMSKRVVKEFGETLNILPATLDREHSNAWRDINNVTFEISKSLAPNVLNPDVINATRYALLSNVRAPLLEENVSPEKRKEMHSLMHTRQENLCYSGHSNLLVPRSALWRLAGSIDSLIQAMSVWIITLEKNGCTNLIKAGASGVAQAFSLSLLAAKFTPLHLEIKLEPKDLYREFTAKGISLSDNAALTIGVRLDLENRPYLLVSSTSRVYVCDAGCLNPPEPLGKGDLHLPVKVTDPLTPILYFSENKFHLEQLRNTIHIVEVINAPAHEQELIALHKHGHRLGGLPIAFWVFLAALVVIFHLFLFKLLYSEWKKAEYTPYNYYLRQHYVRNH